MQVPGFLLRRLYVKGSLRNTSEGFAFQLKNSLGSGYARKLHPLVVDGEEIPLGQTTFEYEGRRTPFSAVSDEEPFTLAMNQAITIAVEGRDLDGGPHKIGMRFDVPGMGTLGFDFTDAPANE